MSDDTTAAAPPTSPAPQHTGPSGFDVAAIRQQLADETVVRRMAKQEVLIVHADAARLRLRSFEEAIRKRTAWQAPLGFAFGFLTSLITIMGTRDFNGLFGMNRDQLIGACWAALFLSVAWTCAGAVSASRARKGGTVEDVIRELSPSDPTA